MAGFAGRRYLILDDDQQLKQALAVWLEREGFVPAPGPTSLAEVTAPAAEAPDLVFIHLLEDGREAAACEATRTFGHQPGTAVVIVAEHPDDEQLARCLRAGAAAYLGMPLTAEKLHWLDRMLQRRWRRAAGAAPEGFIVHTEREQWIEITAASRSEYVTRFSEFVERLAATRLPEADRGRLIMAIQEMGQNAVEWGNSYDERKKVRLSYCILDDEIAIKVEDEGPGFDPAGVPDPTEDPEGHIQRRLASGKRPGGYGLHLARAFMDEVRYNQRGNILIMRKYLPARPVASTAGPGSTG